MSYVVNPDPVQVVVFDAYGTLVRRLTRGPDAFRQLFRFRHPRVPETDLVRVLKEGRSFNEWARIWGVPDEALALVEPELQPDLMSVLPFPETRDALKAVRQAGRKVVVCSNLAPVFTIPLRQHLAGLIDHYILSYEVGAIKPEAAIYDAILAKTGLPASAHLMIGDRWREDVEGPRERGFQAQQVVRPGQPGTADPEAWSDLRPLIGLWESSPIV